MRDFTFFLDTGARLKKSGKLPFKTWKSLKKAARISEPVTSEKDWEERIEALEETMAIHIDSGTLDTTAGGLLLTQLK